MDILDQFNSFDEISDYCKFSHVAPYEYIDGNKTYYYFSHLFDSKTEKLVGFTNGFRTSHGEIDFEHWKQQVRTYWKSYDIVLFHENGKFLGTK